MNNIIRKIYLTAGMIATGLGIIGVFVPLMPTTCFIILAAWAFAKSSPIAYQRLLNNPHLGPKIKDWQEHRIISRQSKRIANISITLSFALSLFIVRDSSIALLILVSLMIGLLLFINSRPSEPAEKSASFSRAR
ncbi:MAG: YbaN family protein [Thiotrichales bacterium]|nr:YbaN family protein [Thiotrichales bacterium]